MRTLILTLLLFAQAQTYPPPYPRAGVTKLLENDRVVVWDVLTLTPLQTIETLADHVARVVFADSNARLFVQRRGGVWGAWDVRRPARGQPSTTAPGAAIAAHSSRSA